MNKIKKILIILGILLIIAVIILLVVVKNEKKNQENAYYETPFDYEDSENIEIKLSFSEYKIISNCVQSYLNILNTESSRYYGRDENNNFVKMVEEDEIKGNIYDLLNVDYLNENNISKNNIYEYINTIDENKISIVLDIIKVSKEEFNINQYKVKALSANSSNKADAKIMYLVVGTDTKNKTFSITPLKDEKEFDDYKVKENVKSIEQNDNNMYFEDEINNEKIAREYFSNYKNIMLISPEIAYEFLNEEYKEKRFSTLKSFEKYLEKNREIIEKIRIEGYDVITNEVETEYVCVDQFNNVYIFNEIGTLDFNVLLDLYTIDLPQFIEKYDDSNAQQKVKLNIDKIRSALNSGDYNYVYRKLADSFKQNKFKTQEEFEEYIKDALFNNISITYKNFSNEGTTYIYELVLTDFTGENTNQVNMEIIMQLKDDRDFVMSFSIK